MVGFELSDEQRAIRAAARRFATEAIRPVAAAHDRDASFALPVLRAAHELGMLHSGIPAAYDGPGLPLFEQCLIDEEVAWGCAGVWASWLASELVIAPLALFGSDDQKRRYLPMLAAAGELHLGSFALSEPGGGSDVAGISTTATKRGSEYVLSGAKQWITDAGYADFYVVFATVDRAARQNGITAFIVDKDTPGVVVGRNEDKIGVRCSDTRPIHLEECVVPEASRLGQEREGFKIAMTTLRRTRPKVAAACTGISRAAMEHATQYALERKSAGKPIASYQAIQLMLADMAKEVLASRLLTWNASIAADAGDGRGDLESSIAKCFASDAALRIAADAVQVFGALGCTRDYPVEKLLRDAKVMQVGEGTNQIQRLVIAGELTRAALRGDNLV